MAFTIHLGTARFSNHTFKIHLKYSCNLQLSKIHTLKSTIQQDEVFPPQVTNSLHRLHSYASPTICFDPHFHTTQAFNQIQDPIVSPAKFIPQTFTIGVHRAPFINSWLSLYTVVQPPNNHSQLINRAPIQRNKVAPG